MMKRLGLGATGIVAVKGETWEYFKEMTHLLQVRIFLATSEAIRFLTYPLPLD